MKWFSGSTAPVEVFASVTTGTKDPPPVVSTDSTASAPDWKSVRRDAANGVLPA